MTGNVNPECKNRAQRFFAYLRNFGAVARCKKPLRSIFALLHGGRNMDSKSDTRAAKVLLADDEVSFVETMSKRLNVRNFDVLTASDGDQALEQIEKFADIEVVVLDIRMPGKDGIQTLAEIKQKNPLVQVIMLTGHGDVMLAVESMKSGAFDYLTKPCDISQLVSAIEAAASEYRKYNSEINMINMRPYISAREKRKLIAAVEAAAGRKNPD